MVTVAAGLGEQLLRPAAEQVDQEGVPRAHLDALADAGLFGVTAPQSAGGSDCTLPVMRAIVEELAAADTTTWFVWTQHHTPVRTLARSDNASLRDDWLPRLASGAAVAGVAFTHLRRPGPPAVSAHRVEGGWRFDGEIAWLTSWRLADVFLVGAQHVDEVVWALLPLADQPGVAERSLGLAAMNGTATVSVTLADVEVADSEVVLVESLAQWRAGDALHTVDVSPAVFGVTREALRLLRLRDEPSLRAAADQWVSRLNEMRSAADAYAVAAEPAAADQRLRLRADAHLLACDATTALVAAGAGRSMLLDQPAQRLARVAHFLLVQGQTADVRTATVRALAARTVATAPRDG